MDVERNIKAIQIEADVDHQFDDLVLNLQNEVVSCQIKDFKKISIKDITVKNDSVLIKRKVHKISSGKNLIFVKSLELEPNSKILGFSAFQKDNVFIIGLSRVQICEIIEQLYSSYIGRIPNLEKSFEGFLDRRQMFITRKDLPHIEVFSTKLVDKTVNLRDLKLESKKIIQIEGKPGVGKSHLVNHIELNTDDILYRFWISNQDINYRNRLKFKNFIYDISKKLFGDLVTRSDDEIIKKLEESPRLLIIDGLDHIENYNNEQLDLFIKFLNYNWINTKVVIFSRPLKIETRWEKMYIDDWNIQQVQIYLDEMLMISDYSIVRKIYKISRGYPIIVNYLGKHYRKFHSIPKLSRINDLNEYYDQLIDQVRLKTVLSIFLCTKSYLMKSELESLLDNKMNYQTINEFISEFPYLFEIKINRISLIHDSFNTYIRESKSNYKIILEPIYSKVYESIMAEESRYQSRFGLFDLSQEQKFAVIQKYSNIDCFHSILEKCIDYEALRSFYSHIRNELVKIDPDRLNINEYYDLGLILNIVNRDHFSTLNRFLYTYIQTLISNGYSIENITSSEFLFGMFVYITENNIDVLLRVTSDNNYSIDNYYSELMYDLQNEKSYFDHLEYKITMNANMRNFLSGEMPYRYDEYMLEALVNVYIHGTNIAELKELEVAITEYVDKGNLDKAENNIIKFMSSRNMSTSFVNYILSNAFVKLKALGMINTENDYINSTMEEIIDKYRSKGSFELRDHIHNYIRLANFKSKKIEIENISKFLSMYYMRKDYTLVNTEIALIIFEKQGYITPNVSIDIIMDAQELSEKGIRHILHSYIKMSDNSIINKLRENYDFKRLNIRWLELPVEHIEMLRDDEFHRLMYLEFNKRYIYSYINYDSIKNVLKTRFENSVLDMIIASKKSLKFKTNNAVAKLYSEYGVKNEFYNEDEIYRRKPSEEYYTEGKLTADSINYIIDNNLTLSEVASCTDANNNPLGVLNIYTAFDFDLLKANMQTLLHSAINSKIKSIDMHGNLYYFVGNSLKLIDNYDCSVNWDKLSSSFMKFIEISLLKSYLD